MRCRLRSVAVVLAFGLVAAGCFGSGEDDPAAGPSPTRGPSDQVTPTPTSTPTPTPEPEPARADPVLDDRWYEDSSGDGIPDFLAEEMGLDPTQDSCAAELDCPGPALAEAMELTQVEENVLLVLDASGSMEGSAGGGVSKMRAAKEALERYVVGTPDHVSMGFMVYGHTGSNRAEDQAESCAGIDLLAPLGEIDHTNVGDVLAQFDATGYTPLAAALEASRDAFAQAEPDARNRVIMVSDGIETCGGDPVAQTRALMDSGIDVTIDVIGFDVPDAETAQLRDIAEAGGGTYIDARTTDDLNTYFETQRQLWLALLDQALCFNRYGNTLHRCYNRLRHDVFRTMKTHIDEAETSEERSLLTARSSEIREDLYAKATEARDRGKDGFREITDMARDVRERMRERYGEDISAEMPCTFGVV